MSKKRVGIYGGTFNPPHKGHTFVAEAFREQMALDELLIIPDDIPPHKVYSGSVTAEERLEMCVLAFSHIDNAKISDMEIRRGGKSYTYLTLEELSSPEVELFLLIGSDMLLTFDTWRRFDYIFSLATVCYVIRELGDDIAALVKEKCDSFRREYGAKIYEIESAPFEVSSSDIRASSDEYRCKYLPTEVYDYIKKNRLYEVKK